MNNDIEKFTLLLKELKRVYSSYVSEMCYARDNWDTVAENDIARAEDPYEKTWALNEALSSIRSIDRILSGIIKVDINDIHCVDFLLDATRFQIHLHEEWGWSVTSCYKRIRQIDKDFDTCCSSFEEFFKSRRTYMGKI